MSILGFFLSLIACAGAGFAGARYMAWRIERDRVIAENEDPRDTQIRELLAEIKVLRRQFDGAKTAESEAGEELNTLRTQLDEIQGEAERARRDFETTQLSLHEQLGQQGELENSLERLRRENDSLKTRVQELEMEASMGSESDLLDPSLQVN